MVIVWTQIANAVSMLSPLMAWWHHRKNKAGTCGLTRTMICHIPVSFMYHLVSGFGLRGLVRQVLKALDLSLIHIYAVQTSCALMQRMPKAPLTNFPTMLNFYCVFRVCQGHEDTGVRMTSLYLCSHTAMRHLQWSKKKQVVLIGGLSSAFFYFDDRLGDWGHSIFHIMLGRLHHEILCLI